MCNSSFNVSQLSVVSALRRGLIMGVWNSHTSVGNILGSLIAGAFVSSQWGMSFIVPGLIIASTGVLCFFFLVESEFTEPGARFISRDFYFERARLLRCAASCLTCW